MRTRLAVQAATLLVLTLAHVRAGAQTTSDGLKALAHGNTPEALQILRAAADAHAEPDALAQFFLAMVYESGQPGTQGHPLRACGLYLRAARPDNPFARHATRRAEELGRGNEAGCTAAGLGKWTDTPAAAFELGPEHWVRTEPAGLTVSYRGVEQFSPTGLGGADVVFLPTVLTSLGREGADADRHFVEFRAWGPNDPLSPSAWTLTLTVFEVAGAKAVWVGSAALAHAAHPSPTLSPDGRGGVRINAAGKAEIATPVGPTPEAAR